MRVFFMGFVVVNRFGVGAHVAAHQVRILADQFGRGIDAVLRKRNLQGDHIDDGGIAESLGLGFARLGDHGELHDALLQRDHALDGAADDPQADVFQRVEADSFQTDFERELGGGAGDMRAADLAFADLRVS